MPYSFLLRQWKQLNLKDIYFSKNIDVNLEILANWLEFLIHKIIKIEYLNIIYLKEIITSVEMQLHIVSYNGKIYRDFILVLNTCKKRLHH